VGSVPFFLREGGVEGKEKSVPGLLKRGGLVGFLTACGNVDVRK
jgi:hypothetical protein